MNPSVPQQPTGPSHRRSGLLTGLVVALLIALGVCVLTVVHQRLLAAAPGIALVTSASAPPADWQTYRDPAGYFRIRVPPGWQAAVQTSQGSLGNRTGGFTFTGEGVTLADAMDPTGLLSVSLDVEPLPTAFARTFACQNQQFGEFGTSLDGVPAGYSDWTWFLNTPAAHYQISTPFSPHHEPALPAGAGTLLPTPVPSATIAADQQQVATVIASFQPIPASALSC